MSNFSFEYTNLTPEQVKTAVKAPITLEHSDKLAGQTLNFALDGGAALSLKFNGGSTLTVKGLDVAADSIGYALLELGSVVLIAYKLPDSLTSHIVVADLVTRLAAVYETWLCGERVPAREVNREVYTGYVTGREVPTHRPAATKRLVGKAVRWSGDAGTNVTIYATPMYSSYVPGGSDQTFTAPTDYYEFDGHTYLYARTECEFSDELVLEVFDLYTMKLIGIRTGFTNLDEYEFRAYSASGKILGQFAAYGPFGVEYDQPFGFPPRPSEPSASDATAFPAMPKGMRMAYRPFNMVHPMTLDEVKELAAKTGAWTGAFAGVGKEKRCMPTSGIMSGRTFKLRFDGGKVWEYETTGQYSLKFRHDSDWVEERYEAFEADDNLAFFTHTSCGIAPTEIFQFAVDFDNGLVTCLISRLDNEKYTREPTQEWLFGVIEIAGVTPSAERHGFTDELVGKSFTWTYNDQTTSQHIYTTAESYSWSIMMNGTPGMMWSSPCKYVKIRDGVSMMSWIEHRSAGTQGTFLFNTKTMHDCGTCYGITHDQIFEYNTFGAEARNAGTIYS
ncbi:MAG: molybdenum cofactor biosynthesis F family protein [Oscillospiraceae bacterium]|jgi:hypothetical protein|nr:molybdenum cofactor biosynthesis F family protein [Oscillospiraceae bacterium]